MMETNSKAHLKQLAKNHPSASRSTRWRTKTCDLAWSLGMLVAISGMLFFLWIMLDIATHR